ncbi:MAG: MotA/TolQ/ExbB proton channel family protein [Gammaproteobacteria bacterium]|nr:MotA/TolQ/ExbB proton channel family protein [Gammaproteobacteria bacterium]MCW8986076.1 MotA/TolQ/ExbB proton channel family protein [Gammaproteobacteria bacterium]MCW9030738.1 MotA/TolQ/ExbB proton channel family protein [Gammaproteobacteria bacterium]
MQELKDKKYLATSKKRFDPFTLVFSVTLLAAVLISALGIDTGLGVGSGNTFLFKDFRSFFFVVGGTLGILLFQFDLETFVSTFMLVIRSFIASPTKQITKVMDELDETIIKGTSIRDLREANEITGDLLNDIVYMIKEKLFYEEIEDFVSNRIASAFLIRKVAVSLLNKGAKVAPALGLLGTVIGLIEVLQSLEDPSKIGPAMSLALMTTAFGSVLGSLVFTPLAGRLEHHNSMYVETHKLLMNRVSVLIRREDRQMDSLKMNKKLDMS